MKNTCLLLFLFLNVCFLASAQNFEGTIFLDKNENGIQDTSEKGISNISVSNGVDIVKTNRKGYFKIPVGEKKIIFPILPTGFDLIKGQTWWHHFKAEDSMAAIPKTTSVKFGLKKIPVEKKFKVLAIGDIQVDSEQEIIYAGRTVLSEMMRRNDYDFSLFLGDLVNDQPGLFKPLNKMISELSKPAWFIYGNHDKNPQKSPTFRHGDFIDNFGPRTHAFFKNDILFVSMNSILPSGKFGYKGVYRENDLAFLKHVLKLKKQKQLVVISQHIPMLMMENKDQMFEVLKKQKNVLVLSAHIHTIFQSFYKTKYQTAIHELTAGAVAGTWWRGEKNWEGIPLAIMQDGSPRGYFEVDFDKNKYSFTYKGVGLSPEKQMSIWIGKNNDTINQTIDSENRDILVNVYAGSKRTKVNMQIDDSNEMKMTKTKILDPFINRIKILQRINLYPNKTSQKAPYLSRSSPHMWKAMAPESLSEGLHKLKVSARDEYGLNHQETVWFWVKP